MLKKGDIGRQLDLLLQNKLKHKGRFVKLIIDLDVFVHNSPMQIYNF